MVFSSGTVINQNTFGCFPYKKKDPVTQKDIYVYNFDISRYIQGILTRNDKAFNMVLFAPFNESIYITETSTFTVFTGTTAGPINYPAIGRIRLGGGNHTRHRMKLHIVYTEID